MKRSSYLLIPLMFLISLSAIASESVSAYEKYQALIRDTNIAIFRCGTMFQQMELLVDQKGTPLLGFYTFGYSSRAISDCRIQGDDVICQESYPSIYNPGATRTTSIKLSFQQGSLRGWISETSQPDTQNTNYSNELSNCERKR